ncbi:hypothetical protein AB6A40_007786 [Gnathostoma spinigerum]|uniref:Uncharacterized protein n=1 Tax=Gnathostoma spinigerum TaxID=75299 RepID=A0ABD6EWN2_9BILA
MIKPFTGETVNFEDNIFFSITSLSEHIVKMRFSLITIIVFLIAVVSAQFTFGPGLVYNQNGDIEFEGGNDLGTIFLRCSSCPHGRR